MYSKMLTTLTSNKERVNATVQSVVVVRPSFDGLCKACGGTVSRLRTRHSFAGGGGDQRGCWLVLGLVR